MKKISLLLLLVCFMIYTKAQNIFPATGSTGIGTPTPNASSILEIKSTAKGILVPRMPKALRDAIAAPATGLLIYQTNSTPGFYYYSGTAWIAVSSTGANTSLSNLNTPTKVNVNLLPDSNNLRNLGNATTGWKNIFAAGSIFLGGIKTLNVGIDSYDNLFVGQGAGAATTTGNSNTATGYYSFSFNTTGQNNTATGVNALLYNTTGTGNTALGYHALLNNSTASNNTANGFQALRENTLGYNNTAYGANSLLFNTTGFDNSAEGNFALFYNTTGVDNIAVGGNALLNNATGSGNTAIGYAALSSITDGYYNTAVGSNAGPGTDLVNTTALGSGAYTTASYQVRIGNSSVTSIGGYANWTNLSDGRVKKNIKQNVPGLSFINKLQPVTYNLDLNAADAILQRPAIKDKDGKMIQPSAGEMLARKQKEEIVYTGFIAQDVEKAARSLNFDFSGVDAAKNSKDLYGLRYSDFVVPLVKAVQELSKQNDDLSKQTEENQKQIDALKVMIVSGGKTNASLTAKDKQQSIDVTQASLGQNTPNPFNGTTTIHYTLPQSGNGGTSAQIIISDKSGKILKQVTLSGNGKGAVNIDASLLSSGTYDYALYVDGKLIGSKQMVIAK